MNHRAELLELIRTRSFGRGRITLASGRESDYYIDMRPTTLHPTGATAVGELIVDALAGDPVTIARSVFTGCPAFAGHDERQGVTTRRSRRDA